ncbi:unnamed protein product [Trichogramma brassicae]|uniref:Uncharacterized protein n=1 Tax=Trichogramma brassicae TaxID=86971 RepID=A0A6H5IMX5_9HYME|nr:unnamed protein product [Trichogramma brassicae]
MIMLRATIKLLNTYKKSFAARVGRITSSSARGSLINGSRRRRKVAHAFPDRK